MDPGATTAAFRDRYLRILREAADPFLWPAQRRGLRVEAAALGDMSQAIGAALAALYRTRLP
jgi:glucokinase